MKKQLLTKKEVADSLSVDTHTVDELINQHQLEIIKVKPGIIRIKRASLNRYLNQSSNNRLTFGHIFLFLWIAAILAFVLQLAIIIKYFDEHYPAPNWVSVLFLSNVGLGIIYFLGMIFLKEINISNIKWFPNKINIWLVSVIYLLSIVTPVLAASSGSKKGERMYTVTSPTPTTTNSPTPTVQSKPKVTTSTTNSDPPVHCSVPSNCGGGTTPLKKSECDKSTCCLVEGVYKFTTDSSQCEDAIIKCNIHPDCGGGFKEMKRSDCRNMVCCQTNGSWVLRSKGTCDQEQKVDWYKFCNDLYPDRYSSQILMDGYQNCLNK